MPSSPQWVKPSIFIGRHVAPADDLLTHHGDEHGETAGDDPAHKPAGGFEGRRFNKAQVEALSGDRIQAGVVARDAVFGDGQDLDFRGGSGTGSHVGIFTMRRSGLGQRVIAQ